MGNNKIEFAAKCLYHIAETHFWEGEYSDCINLLEKLKKEYPMFEGKKVDELIKSCQMWQNASREENLWSAAEKAFARGDYPSARLYYKWFLRHLPTNAYPRANSLTYRNITSKPNLPQSSPT